MGKMADFRHPCVRAYPLQIVTMFGRFPTHQADRRRRQPASQQPYRLVPVCVTLVGQLQARAQLSILWFWDEGGKSRRRNRVIRKTGETHIIPSYTISSMERVRAMGVCAAVYFSLFLSLSPSLLVPSAGSWLPILS